MSDIFASRQQIACEASYAATHAWMESGSKGATPPNPYPEGSDAYAVWAANFESTRRHLHANASEAATC